MQNLVHIISLLFIWTQTRLVFDGTENNTLHAPKI